MTYATAAEPTCPKCGGQVYDNRAENDQRLARGEKLRPDYKCRDRACDGAIWRPKNGQPAPRAAAPAQTKQAYSAGGPLPYEQEETGAPPIPALDGLFTLYDVCFEHAFSLANRRLANDASHEGIAAMAATLFIAARKS